MEEEMEQRQQQSERTKRCGVKLTLYTYRHRHITLSANIIHCADVGAVTFRKTAQNMKLLARLTDQLSRPNGAIETMLKFCESDQHAVRDSQERRRERRKMISQRTFEPGRQTIEGERDDEDEVK
ncbi:hypothetical protein V8E54_011752 [Elaphomyces granulatus]